MLGRKPYVLSTTLVRSTHSMFIIGGGGCIARLSYRSTQCIPLFSNSTKSSFLRKQSSSSSVVETRTATNAVQRHGPGDKVITLDVGGKKFQTLRSTISQNDVLYDHVLRAESNLEYAGDAVFIDRDPKHFDVILAYLRNRADGLLVGSSDAAAATSSTLRLGRKQTGTLPSPPSFKYTSTIQLPTDSKLLSEMYIESIHYRIPELQDLICSRQVLTRIFNLFGSNNPFTLAGSAYANMKRLLILFGGVMTGAGSWVYAQAVAAQAKTNELMLAASDEGTDVTENAVEYWKNQSQLWSKVAKKWSGTVKDEKDNN